LEGISTLFSTTVRRKLFLVATLASLLVAFDSAQAHEFKFLHKFTGPPDDGELAAGTLLSDGSGNLYGATFYGGDGAGESCPWGCGMVFKLAADGSESILYSFVGGNDGDFPGAGLIADKAGRFYGTTSGGGGKTGYGYGSLQANPERQ